MLFQLNRLGLRFSSRRNLHSLWAHFPLCVMTLSMSTSCLNGHSDSLIRVLLIGLALMLPTKHISSVPYNHYRWFVVCTVS